MDWLMERWWGRLLLLGLCPVWVPLLLAVVLLGVGLILLAQIVAWPLTWLLTGSWDMPEWLR